MKLKLDENLGRAAQAFLARAGHDISTVVEQNMTGSTDQELFAACAAEGRAIVSLDLDFANPFRFEPEDSAGIIVLRPGAGHSRTVILGLLARLVTQLASSDPNGRLWIVEPNRIRQYEPRDGSPE